MSETEGEIPCGDGFLYPGACSDTCGQPYWQPELGSKDARTGHECCSTVAAEVVALRAEIDRQRARADAAEARAATLQAEIDLDEYAANCASAMRQFKAERDRYRQVLREIEDRTRVWRLHANETVNRLAKAALAGEETKP